MPTKMKIIAHWGTSDTKEYEGVVSVHSFYNGRSCVSVKLDSGYTFACDWFEVVQLSPPVSTLAVPGV